MARVRWWGTGLVALVLLVVGRGLPLLDGALGGGGIPLRAGTVLSVGTARDGVRPVTFTVPATGWALNGGRSFLNTNARLTRDAVVFNLSVVVPLAPLDPRALWDGLARIVALNGGSRLRAEPGPITTAQGLTGLTGDLAGRGRVGTACVLTGDTLGATVTASGSPAAYRVAAVQVEAMVRTIRIAR